MKKLLYTLAALLMSNLVLAQTDTQNYVKSTTYQVKTTDGDYKAGTTTQLISDDKIETVTYFDGLGRPIQTVAKQAGGSRQDIITPMVYDQFGRHIKDYLPITRGFSNNPSIDALRYHTGLSADNEGNIPALESYYNTKYPNEWVGVTPNPFSQKVLEPSPLNRVLEQAAPGQDWAVGNGHTISFDYATNGFEDVKLFSVEHPNGSTEQTELVDNGFYSSDQLYKTVTRDENWISGSNHTTEEFKNKQGQVILKRTYNSNQPHETYYVYDDFGNLTYVLPPEASFDIVTNYQDRAMSQTNYSWINLVNVNKDFAETYSRQLQDYDNENILNADIDNAFGGQGGFTISTFNDSDQVLLSINFSALQELELKKGELISLKEFGDFRNTELGRISGLGYSYTFYITKNSIYIDGHGKLFGINEVFNSNTKLTYNEDQLWTKWADIDVTFAKNHETQVLDHAKNTGQNPLNVYLNNSYGGQGGINMSIDDSDNITLSLNISSTMPLELKEGVIVSLDSKRRFVNQTLGILSGTNYHYTFTLEDNAIVVRGGGGFNALNGIVFPNPPGSSTSSTDTAVIEGLSYIYHYDYRNRLIEKKIPGKGWEHIVYDKLDRPVLTQDAKLRIENKWLFTKYDVFGRIAYTGTHDYLPQNNAHNSGRLELQDDLNVQTIHNDTRQNNSINIGGTALYYNNQSLPNSNIELLTINYYDSYADIGLVGELLKQNGDMVYDKAIDTNVKGLPVCSKVKVLDSNDWITSVTYFDNKSMVIYMASKNDYLNTIDVVKTDYDFVGKVLETESSHIINGLNSNAIVLEDYFTYDHTGRLLTQTQTINGSLPELIVNNHYDDLGQLKSKDVGGAVAADPVNSIGLQTIDYDYNIRGWLKSINNGDTAGSDLFGFKIGYNNPEESNTPLYNGNISETFWKTANDHKERGYDYVYDALNRIEIANYHGNYQLVNTTNQFENYSLIGESNAPGVTYDMNGNIISLRRFGLDQNNTTVDVIDALEYDYDPLSNKLMTVTDTATEDGFKDGSNETENDYLYDINGNMIQDLNKGITDIEYNHLNLPTKITFAEGNSIGNDEIKYIYDATGIKLKKIVVDMSLNNGINSQAVEITEYAGGYIYKESAGYSHTGQYWQGSNIGHGLQFLSHAEGYAEPANDGTSNYNYVYQYKDHLGNIRLSYADSDNNGSIDASTEIIEENNYYPFGLEHKGYNNVVNGVENNFFNFNGKELDENLGLNVIEMDWRQYDPALGRFNVIDPMAHKRDWLTPYNFVQNNPILRMDPSGLLDDDYGLDQNGKVELIKKTDDKTDTLYSVTRGSDGELVKDDNGEVVKNDTGFDDVVDSNDSVTVEKGILNNIENKKYTEPDGTEQNIQMINVSSGSEKSIKSLFEFASANSFNEFSYSSFDSGNKFLSTSFLPSSELSMNLLYKGNGVLLHHVHSHPNDTYLAPSPGDIGSVGILSKRYPSARFEIYAPALGQYKDYNAQSSSFELDEVHIIGTSKKKKKN